MARRVLRRREVEARVGLKKSDIYARIAAGEFPRPIPLGARAVGWPESEVGLRDWEARPTWDRISRGLVEVEAACVAVLGSIEPGPLGEYLRGGVGLLGVLHGSAPAAGADAQPPSRLASRTSTNPGDQS